MGDGAGLAVDPGRADNPPAEMLADRLVAETDAEQRSPLFRAGGDQSERDAGLVGRARPRRNQDGIGAAGHRFGRH
jgi:hypothetical protein